MSMAPMEKYVHDRIAKGDSEIDVYNDAIINCRYPAEKKMVQMWIEQTARPGSPRALEMAQYPFAEAAMMEATGMALQTTLSCSPSSDNTVVGKLDGIKFFTQTRTLIAIALGLFALELIISPASALGTVLGLTLLVGVMWVLSL